MFGFGQITLQLVNRDNILKGSQSSYRQCPCTLISLPHLVCVWVCAITKDQYKKPYAKNIKRVYLYLKFHDLPHFSTLFQPSNSQPLCLPT